MIKKIILAIFLCQFTYSQQVLDLKDRAILIEKIQKDRLDNLLPKLMSKNEIDKDFLTPIPLTTIQNLMAFGMYIPFLKAESSRSKI